MKSFKGREAKDFEISRTQAAAGVDNLGADRAITNYAVLVRTRTSAKILYFHLLIGPVGFFGVLLGRVSVGLGLACYVDQRCRSIGGHLKYHNIPSTIFL